MKSVSIRRVCAVIVLWMAALPAVAQRAEAPDLAVGDVFVYAAREPSEDPKEEEGVVVIQTPRPVRQTVRVLEEVACGSATCWLVEAGQELPSYGVAAEKGGNVGQMRAKIEKGTGRLVEIENVLRVAGQEYRRTTAVEGRNSLFASFYGPWMLDLEPGWSEDFDLSGGRTRSYSVTGQETVEGRDCFVVLRTTQQKDGGLVKTTFWIDRDRRVAVQVEEGEWQLSLESATHAG